MGKALAFFKRWMLPLAMTAGVGIYLILHFVPGLHDGGYLRFSGWMQPLCIGMMLFLQLNLVAPGDLRFKKWHFKILGLQAAVSIAAAALAIVIPHQGTKILMECIMLCFVCPTASAAGVITSKLGGNLPGVLTYTVLANTLASVLIPVMVPLVHPSTELGFLPLFFVVVKRVFSLLLLPCLAAWLIRFLIPKLQKWLEQFAGWAFYIWGFSLMLSISLATDSLVRSGIGLLLAVAIGTVSLACCIAQFWTGRKAAKKYGHGESVTAGQAMGQKNTGFIIWLGVNYLTPVTSIAGGLYAVWHNLVNSWELQRNEDRLRAAGEKQNSR